MHTEFQQYLFGQTDLPDETIRQVCYLAKPKVLRRNESILGTGEICRHKVFVMKGLLKTYHTTTDGHEHILQFSPEQSWTLDVESYDRQVPSRVSIAAVERSEILCWRKTDFDTLLAELPALKQFAEQLISRNTYYSRQRMLTMLSGTPEERYEDFVQRFPGFLSRLPLRMIAAYLGISLKTLTRIRHAQYRR
ncbi:Crp/Fnr family transcriptional regulator [Parapedobacter koreensis]|uniref:cAMP-binding domain of CRP or a regulatory subunit of cAMP-dependent protein kinases n=1 Tax=Parapedobacter koreensis TaxID=332977 RepID=A0A1H7T4J3_9SPHI|nr:Crp/Fnr family transcriptional regulator [Parapedobacter koreensis]SEL78697.1 cAMP-binding domain of CRP or a regulatory subunit of cAMP-dependent protein kinases [Parapedobacter koreensis]